MAAVSYGYSKSMSAAGPVPSHRTVGAREFKEDCLRVLSEVNETGATVVVTRDEVPIACISAPVQERPISLFGRCAGELEILGDIMAPVFGTEEFGTEEFDIEEFGTEEFDIEARPEPVLDLDS